MNKSSKNRKKRLILVTLLIELAVLGCVFVFTVIYLQSYLEHDLQNNLLSTARYASVNISADELQKVKRSNDVHFRNIKDQLIIIEGIYNLRDGLAYIVELREKKPVFSIMTNETPFRNHAYPEEISERIYAVYGGEEIVADYYEDRNGSFISVIVPLYDHSKVIAALEIDFPGEDYRKMLYERVIPFLFGLATLFIFSFSAIFIILLKLHKVREAQTQQAQLQLIQSEKMIFLSRVVAGIMHEVNTPISTIKSTSDVLKRAVEKITHAVETGKSLDEVKSSPLFQKSIAIMKSNNKQIIAAGDRLSRMMERLKKFSRLDEAECQRADINESLETTLSLIQNAFDDKIKIIKDFGEIPPIYAFPLQLNQMFMNLLENARQAVEENGVIEISTSADTSNIYIRIADTGRGIPPEKLSDLFKVNFTTRNSHVRMGMGLWSVYNIIQTHHGNIEVKSEVGKGTEFLINFPIHLTIQKICSR